MGGRAVSYVVRGRDTLVFDTMKKLLIPTMIWCACAVSAAESTNSSPLQTILEAGRDYGEHRAREKRREQREERREAREERRYQRNHDKDKHHYNRGDDRDSKQHRR